MVTVPVARDIMKTSTRIFHPDTGVLEAMEVLYHKKENAALVVGDDFRLVGILTEKDCLRVLLSEVYDRFEAIGR
ncbi:MAG: CBS domain-containing protein, partial [Candidatus Hydrogenedentes bacterium]|nr:CBS domain-containing protein [Candidatus Hydrogenedentota bacterium]